MEWYSAIKIESITDAHSNMDATQTHYSEQKKSGTTEYKLWFRISETLGKDKIYTEWQKASQCLPEFGEAEDGLRRAKGNFWSYSVYVGYTNLWKLLKLYT